MADILDHAARAHAEFSPSSMSKFILCSMSYMLSLGLKDEGSAATEEGTRGHEIAEIVAEKTLKGEFIDKSDLLKDGKYNEEMFKCATQYASFIKKVCAKGFKLDHVYFIERKLIINEDLDIWGTADFIMVAVDKNNNAYLYIIDYKYGLVFVDTKENWQLRTYLVGLMLWVQNNTPYNIVEGTCAIFQPRVNHAQAEPVTYSFTEMCEHLDTITTTVKRIRDWKAAGAVPQEYQTNEHWKVGEHCRFCKAQKNNQCKKYYEHFMGPVNAAIAHSSDILTKPNKDITAKYIKNLGLKDSTRAFIALNRGKIKTIIDSIAASVTNDKFDGIHVDGIKLIKTSAKYDWKKGQQQEIAQKLLERGIKNPIVITEKLVSLSSAKKQLGDEAVSDLLEYVGDNTKLVPDTDKRPDIDPKNSKAALINEIMSKVK